MCILLGVLGMFQLELLKKLRLDHFLQRLISKEKVAKIVVKMICFTILFKIEK